MPLYLRRRRDHYPDDYAQRRFTDDTAHVILCGNLVAGSFHQIQHGPSGGLWEWSVAFGGGGRAETAGEAREKVARAFRANLPRLGLAERPDAKAGPPVYDPPAPNDLTHAPTEHDRWFDRDNPIIIERPRIALMYSGEHLVGIVREIDRTAAAGEWTWEKSGSRPYAEFEWRGQAETMDTAFDELAACWAAWLDWAGLVQKDPLRRGAPRLRL
jgi:hypothetical protein